MSKFGSYRTVKAWVDHVESSPVSETGQYRAGGGPPPPRDHRDGVAGFWVRGPGYDGNGLYVWVPDEIAARDNAGKYEAGQESPEASIAASAAQAAREQRRAGK